MTVSIARTAELQTELDALQDEYTYRINILLDEGREDLATALSDEYVADAAEITARHAA